MKHKFTRRWFVWLGEAIVGVLFIIGGQVSTTGQGTLLTTLGCVFIAIAFFIPIALYRAIQNVVGQNPQFTAPKTLSFDEFGLTVTQPTQKSEMSWSAFRKMTQDDGYVYLHLDNTGTVSSLPKRAFDPVLLSRFLQFSQNGIAKSAL